MKTVHEAYDSYWLINVPSSLRIYQSRQHISLSVLNTMALDFSLRQLPIPRFSSSWAPAKTSGFP
jgi:hypothetical protein